MFFLLIISEHNWCDYSNRSMNTTTGRNNEVIGDNPLKTTAWNNNDTILWSNRFNKSLVKLQSAYTHWPWWRHQMETFSALLALCAGNSTVPVNSPHKGQWRGALMFSLIYAWINDWVNNREAGDLRRHCDHYDVIVMAPVHVRRNSQVQPYGLTLISVWRSNHMPS